MRCLFYVIKSLHCFAASNPIISLSISQQLIINKFACLVIYFKTNALKAFWECWRCVCRICFTLSSTQLHLLISCPRSLSILCRIEPITATQPQVNVASERWMVTYAQGIATIFRIYETLTFVSLLILAVTSKHHSVALFFEYLQEIGCFLLRAHI